VYRFTPYPPPRSGRRKAGSGKSVRRSLGITKGVPLRIYTENILIWPEIKSITKRNMTCKENELMENDHILIVPWWDTVLPRSVEQGSRCLSNPTSSGHRTLLSKSVGKIEKVTLPWLLYSSTRRRRHFRHCQSAKVLAKVICDAGL